MTTIVLLGSAAFLAAKSGVYTGKYLSIWSETKEEKLFGESIVDFLGELLSRAVVHKILVVNVMLLQWTHNLSLTDNCVISVSHYLS